MITRPGVEYSATKRMLRAARHLMDGGEVTATWVMATFGVSWSTAKKDVALIAMYLPVKRVAIPRGLDPRRRCVKLRAPNGKPTAHAEALRADGWMPT